MAENKRPTRLVYNYEKDTGKTDRSHPNRVSYQTQPSVQTGRNAPKERVHYHQTTAGQTPAPLPNPDASPFYDYVAESAASKKTKVKAQKDEYTELVFPPRTVVTATREIPQRNGATQRVCAVQGAARKQTTTLARQQPLSRAGAPKPHTQTRAQSKKPAQKQGGFVALLQNFNRALPKKETKRPVRLSAARAQRRRRSLMAAAGIAVVVFAGALLSITVLFKIESVAVEGDTPYSTADIVTAFGRKEGDNLLAFREKTVVEEMQKKLPYLEGVSIRRMLPGKINLTVTAATEAYSVSSISGWVVLSDTLRVLRIDPQPPEGLPQVVGAEAMQPVLGVSVELEDPVKLNALRALQVQLQEQGLLPATEIDLSDTLNLSFVYAGRIRILLGTSNDLNNKIDWAKYLVTPSGEDSLSETEAGRLDVSDRDDEGRIKAIWRAGAL